MSKNEQKISMHNRNIYINKGRGDHAYSGWRWKNGVKDVGRRCSVGRILRTKKMIKIGSR
jgi:hypothetical protein